MGLYKTNTEELSYKQSAIKLVVVTIVSALIWHRYTIYAWLGVSADWLEKYEYAEGFFALCILWAMVIPFYLGVIGIIETFEKRLELTPRDIPPKMPRRHDSRHNKTSSSAP